MPLVSNIKDQNIFHIFALDIVPNYDPGQTSVTIDSRNLDLDHPCQKWRYFVLSKLYKTVRYSRLFVRNRSTKSKSYNHWEFIECEPDPHFGKICDVLSSKEPGRYVLLNQREVDDRYLYDHRTRKRLEDFLSTQKLSLPLRVCNFATMTPEEQYEACANCAVLVAVHGAGCTNLVFTPKPTPMIEINLRRHWYCDPVCDDHFFGVLSMNEPCNGKLTHMPHFHKADYHNLCQLIGKPYQEIEAVEYGGGFINRSPIARRRIYVDGQDLVRRINAVVANA